MNLDSLWNIIQVVLGIGLVIFVHEAGHFMAARWCKVRVEVFSLGFGPKLFGWKRGGTTYQVAALPLGGYVKMAGEDMFDPQAERRPDDLGSKSVPQRFLIYSGGVIMNMIFALVVFPIIFMIGVPFDQPMISPVAGGAAWLADIEEGTVIEEIDGKPIYAFLHIPNGIALADKGPVEMLVRDPGSDKTRTVTVQPTRSDEAGLNTIDVLPAFDPERRIVVAKGSAAEKAGLRNGYRLVDVKSPYVDLPLLERLQLEQTVGARIEATFLTDKDEKLTVELDLEALDVESSPILGVEPLLNRVHNFRETPLTRQLGLEKGLLILSVAGRPIQRSGDLTRVLLETEGPLSFTLSDSGNLTRTVNLGVVSAEARLQLASNVAMSHDLGGSGVSVKPGSAAERAGLRTGDFIQEIDGTSIKTFGDIRGACKDGISEERALNLVVLREVSGEGPSELTFNFKGEPYTPSYGFGVQRASYVFRAKGPVDAVRAGFISSWRFIEDAFITIKGVVFTKSIDGKNLGGIITIARVANSWAEVGLTKLLFFLCLLSVNLAFLNVLPIPVLDGGQMMFLAIEAVKGSPVSEKVMSYSHLVGFVLIVSLMIYVIKNDIMRWLL